MYGDMSDMEIKEQALSLGACDMIDGADTLAELVALMHTPQGREFCKAKRFPTLGILRSRREDFAALGVYVDAGEVEMTDRDNVIIAGDTHARLSYDDTARPYYAMVMHGARADVIASGYAVCEVTRVKGRVSVSSDDNAMVFTR